jgi:S-DNA-T family DNA segregation ATPase FtsK/SpoIIIE
VKPEFWDGVLDAIPPWGDEVVAILLGVFGIVSLMTLLDVSGDTTISAAWSNALTGLFGYASIVVCLSLLGLAAVLHLRKWGRIGAFPTARVLAFEIAFLALCALLHLGSGSDELRSVARLGQGGGQVGWVLSTAAITLLGRPFAVLAFAIVFVLSLGVVFGIRRAQVREALAAFSAGLAAWGHAHRPPPKAESESAPLDEVLLTTLPTSKAAPIVDPSSAVHQRARAHSVVRIRIDPDRLPPSQRAALQARAVQWAEQMNVQAEMPYDPPAPLPVDVPLPQTPSAPEPVLPSIRRSDFNAVGTIVGKPGRMNSPLMVERPDGRLKRYFTVAGMKEAKAPGLAKRDAELPSLSMLRDIELNLPDEREINHNVVLIENTLLEFDIDVDVVDVKVGPTVTQYAVQPFRDAVPGSADEGTASGRSRSTRISKIASLASDLALALSARRLRLETPVPGHSYIGIEVPNRNPSVVALRSVIESKAYAEQAAKKKSPLFIPLGRDVAGAPIGIDLSQMPHLLIAGTTGSGKSVCIAALAAALILENTPEQMKMVMLDPKMVELSRFNGIPHLLGPVEVDQERIIGVLRWCTREMDRRYKLLEENAARNIDTYNARLGRRRKDDYLPYIVILIDEVGDLMLSHPDETERTITRLAQMARAVGMHMVIATQRPSVDIITGLIKANFPSRIAFAVASGTDSRVILDTVGAETLMGRGDMLYLSADAPAPRRLQGCFISDDEVRALTQYWRAKAPAGELDPTAPRMGPWERGLTRRELLSETDPMLEQAITLVVEEGEASASLIQRKLGIGYPRAARIMDLLGELGVIGEAKEGGRGREVLIRPGKDPFKEMLDKRLKG